MLFFSFNIMSCHDSSSTLLKDKLFSTILLHTLDIAQIYVPILLGYKNSTLSIRKSPVL